MKLFMISLLTLLLSLPAAAQTIKIKTGGSMNIMMKSYTNTRDYQQVENLSFGAFYENTFGYQLDGCINFMSEKTGPSAGYLFAGINYERSSVKTDDFNAKVVLGKNITQNMYTPYIGYGNFLNRASHKAFLYGYAGVSFRQYSGEGEIPIEYQNTVTMVPLNYSYNDLIAFRIGAGIDIENLNDSPVFLSFGLAFDWGTANRGNVTGSFQGSPITLVPEGEKKIDDNIFYISLTLGYEFNF